MAKLAVKGVDEGAVKGLVKAPSRRKRKKRGASATVIGGERRATAVVHVGSPHGNGMDQVRRVLDTVDILYRRRLIDKRQRSAAERLLASAERAGGEYPSLMARLLDGRGGAGGDCAPAAAVLAACEDLRLARAELGARAFKLVVAVVVEGLSVGEAGARLFGGEVRRDPHRLAGELLKMALSDLATLWCPMPRPKMTSSGYVADSVEGGGSAVREVARSRVAHASRQAVVFSEIDG